MKDTVNIDNAYAYLILRSARLFNYNWKQIVSVNGLENFSQEQWVLLDRLYQQESMSQTSLIDGTFNDKANITRILQTMEKRGLIRIGKDPQDQRRHLISITEKGCELHGKVAQIASVVRKELYKGLTDNDFQQLKSILDRLETNLMEFTPPKLF